MFTAREKDRVLQFVGALTRAAFTIAAILLLLDAASARDKAKIEAGQEAYNTYCSACHGDNLASSGQTFDLRRLTANDRSRFQTSVLNGKNQMPPWKGALSDDEIDSIWHYIRDNAIQK